MRVLKKRSGYAEYLRVLAQHKIIFQLDTSFIPGQVAGDCLLSRVPCVGGNGAIERVAFPELCEPGRSIAELCEIGTHLLTNRETCVRAVADSQRRAAERLSFAGVASELEAFFEAL